MISLEKRLTIELIHPPDEIGTGGKLDFPLGLGYVAAAAEKAGHKVRINDLSGRKREDWDIGPADIYGITVYAPTEHTSREIAKICKRINPYSKTVVGGAHPTAMYKQMLKEENYDIIVIGEGEKAILDIVKDFPKNKSIYEKPLDKDLDKYPNPAYDLVDLGEYERTLDGKPALSILTSRGCPYRCSFCGLPGHHKTVKFRSPEKVAEEITYIIENYGINNFKFQDDLFTVNKPRMKDMLNRFKPLEINFAVHGRSGTDRPEDYTLLKEAGCKTIAWGIESGSQKILNLMNKRTTVEKNFEVIRQAKDAGLQTRAFFVLGFPGETWKTIDETMKFIEEANPDTWFISNFVPYPDTDVWNNPKKYGITHIDTDFSKYFKINGTGRGSRVFDVEGITREDFFEMEEYFRKWMKKRTQRGVLQNYEKGLGTKNE